MILEICASNYQSAINAQEAGAHRIELCSELAVGGITPSYGLLKHVMDTISISVFVLIRPRSGNFTYSDAEFDIMKRDIQLCKDLGCAGIVSGVLNTDQTIDTERTNELKSLSIPLSFTFHRAFDWTPNALDALETLKKLKIERVLTSGQSESAKLGIDTLKELKEKAGDDITILPGGGINSENINLFKTVEFKEVHTSASLTQTVNGTPKIKMNSPKLFDETIVFYSDIAEIKSILKQTNHEN